MKTCIWTVNHAFYSFFFFFFFFCAGLKKGLEFIRLNILQIPWPGKKNINCFFIYNSPDLGWWGGFITGPQAVLVEDPCPKPTPYRTPACILTLSDKHHLLFLIIFFPRGDHRPPPPQCKKMSGFTNLVGTFGYTLTHSQHTPTHTPHSLSHTHTPHTHTHTLSLSHTPTHTPQRFLVVS